VVDIWHPPFSRPLHGLHVHIASADPTDESVGYDHSSAKGGLGPVQSAAEGRLQNSSTRLFLVSKIKMRLKQSTVSSQ
jgi:hypothetical protein